MTILQQTEERPNILIVDTLNFCFRYRHFKEYNFEAEFYSTCKSLARSYNCGKIILTADKYKSKYRTEIYPEYKANRKKDKDDTFRAFLKCYERALEYCVSLGFTLLRFDGVEADDIIASLVKFRPRDRHLWIISSDRDLNQLIRPNVSQFSHITRVEYTDIDVDNFLSVKFLVGDTGDNIKGVEGIGQKRAEQLIDKYGSVAELLDALPIPGPQKFIQNVNNSRDLIERNIKLMDLLDADVFTSEQEQIIKDALKWTH